MEECCPEAVPGNSATRCGGQGRGVCVALNTNDYHQQFNRSSYSACIQNDPRIGWPYSFGVRRYCKCEKNWDGPGCRECAEGYIKDTDNSCVVRTGSQMLIRKNALKMNDEEWATFWRVINESKVTSSDYLVYTGNGTTTTDGNPRLVGNFSFVDNVTVYNVFVWLHYYATKGNYGSPPVPKQCDFAHEQSGFLTWHRAWLLFVERELRKLSSTPDNFTIPYWDWTDPSSLVPLFNNNKRSRMGISYFYDGVDAMPKVIEYTSNEAANFESDEWQTVCVSGRNEGPNIESVCDPSNPDKDHVKRCLGCIVGALDNRELPTADELAKMLNSAPSFDAPPWNKEPNGVQSFRNSLEGWVHISTIDQPGNPTYHEFHNRVHIYMGGIMADVSPAPNDPIFLLHHANIDRLFEVWLRKEDRGEYVPNSNQAVHPGHAKNDWIIPIVPFVTHGDIYKTAPVLGYEYDNIEFPHEPTMATKASADTEATQGTGAAVHMAVPALTQTFMVAAAVLVGLMCHYFT
ncbi:tyrosinase-like [Corticium candelabrum]|uniref:tyrosinase-like n=1 Tax=Corticium candelabrum TaxID=121492 RepID=UPI002E25BFFA|nr:tyrosinase-like [Corticium candelabrum]